MLIHKDFAEFLRLLREKKVEYIIVGGYAVGFHGYVRATKDIDVLFRKTPANIKKLRSVLNLFGFPDDSLEEVAFSDEGSIIRMGVSPVMIELINSISGVTFTTAWKNRVTGKFGNVDAWVLSKADLIRNKKAAGRLQDLADVDELKKM